MSYRITATEDSEGRTILRYSGDAQGLVDACAARARAHREHGRFAPKGDIRKVLSLDPVVMMQIAHEHGLQYNDPAIFQIAKDRDYAKFRCVDDPLLWKGAGKKRLIIT